MDKNWAEIFHWFCTVLVAEITVSPVWLQMRYKVQMMNGRILALERDHANCVEEKSALTAERAQLQAEILTEWPSDNLELAILVDKMKTALRAARRPVVARDVITIAKRMLIERKKPG